MRDNDSNKGIGGLLDPGRASKEDLRREELNKFYRDHIENSKPPTPRKEALSIIDYMPTPTLMTPEKKVVEPIVKKKITKYLKDTDKWTYEGWADGLEERTRPAAEPSNKVVEKTLATFGNPKSKGRWAEFVQKNKMVDDYLTRPPNKNREILKAKPKAMPILTFVDKVSVLYGGQEKRRYDDAGNILKATPDPKYQKEADRINSLQKMDHFMIENSSVKHPDYPKAPPKNVTAQDIKKIYEDKK